MPNQLNATFSSGLKNEYTIFEYYGEDGKLEKEYIYKKSLLIKEISYDGISSEIYSLISYLYNAQGKLIKKTTQTDIGNRVANFAYNQRGWDNDYTYSTDAKGNWIEQKEKTNNAGEEFYFTERTIIYEQ